MTSIGLATTLDRLTFSSAIEFDHNLLVHILGQVEDVFLLPICLGATLIPATTATMVPSTTAIASATSTSKLSSFRHVGNNVVEDGAKIVCQIQIMSPTTTYDRVPKSA